MHSGLEIGLTFEKGHMLSAHLSAIVAPEESACCRSMKRS
jgi:hypothetical protein